MCGIFSILNNDYTISTDLVNSSFTKGKNRGPEFSTLNNYLKLVFGFHRLAINGLNDESNQPIIVNNVILICNGEIYNYKYLYKYINEEPNTDSDCEIIIHLYIKYGIEQTLTMLDGEFSFILLDNRITHDLNNKLYVARDPYGVRPLYYLKNYNTNLNNNARYGKIFGFASEMKCLVDICNTNISKFKIKQFSPGTYSVFNLSNLVYSEWQAIKENIPYFIPTFSYTNSTGKIDSINEIYKSVSYYLNEAVIKRCNTTERPIACLLSGGLDSSLVAALTNHFYKMNDFPYKLETYSIGIKGSEDLKYARFVADYLQTKHTEIIVTEKEMFEAIPEVIYAIESYDVTTIRASIGNYLLGKYISKHSNAKVILNGDGSDEVCGGYLYMNKCPDDIEFDKETRRLLKDIHLFDVLRSDKCISFHGLEPRTPFLDKSFVNHYLSISPYLRNHNNGKNIEKYILRNSFSKENFKNFEGKQLLPDEVLWRKKEAFSDGVTCKGRSLYQILQEHISFQLNIHSMETLYNVDDVDESILMYSPNIECEKYYYKQIFLDYFPNCEKILPYYWMPKYTNASDPSARTLDIYNYSNNYSNKYDSDDDSNNENENDKISN